jgi:small subunit ribosomal protein S20
MIRGLFCLLFPKKSFEELDGGQHTFRQKTCKSLRSMVRTYIKNVVKAIDAKDAEKAQAAYVLAVPVLDRMADKGIIHKNKAARHKGRLNGHIKALNLAAAA